MASSSAADDTPSSPLVIKNLSMLAAKTPQDPTATEHLEQPERIAPSNPSPSAFDSSSSTADLYGVRMGNSADGASGKSGEGNDASAAAERKPADLNIRPEADKTVPNPPTSATWRPTFFREQSWSQEDRKRQMHGGLMSPPTSKEGERGWSAKE